jgi:RimJ/RimL family protein N-acetyltransferase
MLNSQQTICLDDVSYVLQLEPFEIRHTQHLSSFFHSATERNFLDLPASVEEFEKLAAQSPALEAMGIAVYRVIALKAIQQHSNPIIIGLIGFHLPAQLEHTAVLGTWLGEPYRGLGLNDLAKRKMIELAYRSYDVKRVIWLVSTLNTRGIRASDKLPYTTRLSPDDMDNDLFAYKKWHDFKTGQSSLLYQVIPDFFACTENTKHETSKQKS